MAQSPHSRFVRLHFSGDCSQLCRPLLVPALLPFPIPVQGIPDTLREELLLRHHRKVKKHGGLCVCVCVCMCVCVCVVFFEIQPRDPKLRNRNTLEHWVGGVTTQVAFQQMLEHPIPVALGTLVWCRI